MWTNSKDNFSEDVMFWNTFIKTGLMIGRFKIWCYELDDCAIPGVGEFLGKLHEICEEFGCLTSSGISGKNNEWRLEKRNISNESLLHWQEQQFSLPFDALGPETGDKLYRNHSLEMRIYFYHICIINTSVIHKNIEL